MFVTIQTRAPPRSLYRLCAVSYQRDLGRRRYESGALNSQGAHNQGVDGNGSCRHVAVAGPSIGGGGHRENNLRKIQRAPSWRGALSVLSDMERMGIRPSVHHFSAAMSRCRQDGRWREALRVLEDMPPRWGVPPNAVCYNVAIGACERSGEGGRAVRLIREMVEQGVEPDVVGYSSAIGACARGGMWGEALGLLREMVDRGIEPNVFSYQSAISAFSH